MKKELPIADHPEIPFGYYCYDGWHKEGLNDHVQGRICPHWEATDRGARCHLLNEEHYEFCPWHLVWDKVKECKINEKRHYEPVLKTDEDHIKEGYTLKHITCRCGKEMDIWSKGNPIV